MAAAGYQVGALVENHTDSSDTLDVFFVFVVCLFNLIAQTKYCEIVGPALIRSSIIVLAVQNLRRDLDGLIRVFLRSTSVQR